MKYSKEIQSATQKLRLSEGKVSWRSPSNIALVKYWGKRPNQIPGNPSISLTLDASHTETSCTYSPQKNDGNINMRFLFEGKESAKFSQRIEKWLYSLLPTFPFLADLEMLFESKNSFPHSAGIASSASAMSAIALCLCKMEEEISGVVTRNFYQKASHISRLGSGSACRSIYGHAALWGKMDGGYDEFAVPMSETIDPVFHSYKDAILIVDQSPKSVSSSVGHGLMNDNIYASPRFDQARKNMREILKAMSTGDLEKTGEIIEQEALTLHAMMLLSNYILLKPGSLEIIDLVRNVRTSEKWPLYFTIDAGPNIHLLYPNAIAEDVNTFIRQELKPHCEAGKIIYDQVGLGPVNLLS